MPSTPAQVRHAVVTHLAGTPLLVSEDTSAQELVITNRVQPERGEVRVSLINGGYVSWHHPCHPVGLGDFFGHLEGMTSDPDDTHTPLGNLRVPALMIIHLLTARATPGLAGERRT
jgi:hypothetical protein